MIAIFDDPRFLEFSEHAVQAFPGHRRIIGKLLIRQWHGNQHTAIHGLAITVGQADQRGVKCPFLAVKQEVPEFAVLLAHMGADDLQEIHGQLRTLLKIALQHRELKGIDLGSALRNGIEDIDGLVLIKREFPDDAAA